MTGLHSTSVDHDDLATAAAEFLADKLPVEPAVTAAAASSRHREIWPELRRLGWFDLLAPDPDVADSGDPGGLSGIGLLPADVGPLFTVLGRRLAPGPLEAGVFVVPWLTARAGTVPPLLRSARGRTAALVDPAGAGAAASGEPPRLSGGRLTGAVRAVPHGGDADVLVIVARTDSDGEALVTLRADHVGVTRTHHETVDPCWSFADVAFAVGDIGDDRVFGASPDLLCELRAWLRILIGCELTGIVSEVFDLTVDFVRTRHQFDRPIGSFQAVKHRLADMSADVLLLRNLAALTLSEATEATLAELDDAAITLKSLASRTGVAICESALQAHGGIGFTAEYPLHCYLKRALTLRSYYGDSRELNNRIGHRALGLERS